MLRKGRRQTLVTFPSARRDTLSLTITGCVGYRVLPTAQHCATLFYHSLPFQRTSSAREDTSKVYLQSIPKIRNNNQRNHVFLRNDGGAIVLTRSMATVPPLEAPIRRSKVFLTKRQFEQKDVNATKGQKVKERMVWSLTGIQDKIKEIVNHYWEGTKKLYRNIKLSNELKRSLQHGEKLTRREHKHIQRTSHDIKILIPFLAIMAIPFTGYILPIIVSVFPGILPSTYLDEEEKLTRQAKFLARRQKWATQLHTFLEQKLCDDPQSAEFKPLLQRIKEGHAVTNEELMHHNFLFDGRLSIENFGSQELNVLCHYYDIWYYRFLPLGYNRRRLYEWLQEMHYDDIRIQAEKEAHSDYLSTEELVEACEERGYRGDLTEESLNSQLSGWLELSFSKGVSSSLLLLAPTFLINHPLNQPK